MTLTNICVLAICICAVWMLEEAVRADPIALPIGRVPADREAETEYVSTFSSTLLSSGFATREETPLASDIRGETIYTDSTWPLPSEAAAVPSGTAFSRGVSSLLTPLTPGSALWSEPQDDSSETEDIKARLPFLNAYRPTGIVQRAGPLALDLYAITFTALYSDLTRPTPQATSDGGFLAALSLQGALSLELGDSIYLKAGFTLYYLPNVNRVGFFFGNGGADTAATFQYKTDLGRWHLTVDDQFRVFQPVGDLLRDYEIDEIATAGRYRFGRPETLQSRPFLAEDIYYSNVTSVSASTQLDECWRFRAQAGHGDVWTASNLGQFHDQLFANAGLFYDSPDSWFMPWLTYSYYDIGSENLQAHQVLAGATLPLTPTFRAYIRGGWTVLEGSGGISHQRLLWELGFVHNVNDCVSHSLFGGYSYVITDFGNPFAGTYGRYTLAFKPVGSAWKFSASIQEDQNDLDGSESLGYQGRATWTLTERTSLEFLAVEAHYKQAETRYERRILKATLTHTFSPTISGLMSYQFSDYQVSSHQSGFSEHLFYLSISKSL